MGATGLLGAKRGPPSPVEGRSLSLSPFSVWPARPPAPHSVSTDNELSSCDNRTSAPSQAVKKGSAKGEQGTPKEVGPVFLLFLPTRGQGGEGRP